MKVIQQINESSYDSYNTFINAIKTIVKDNFESFVPSIKPNPNEYKAINFESVIFGDFPAKGDGIYILKFDFRDWDNPESMFKDMEFVLEEINKKRSFRNSDIKTLVVQLVHYMD